MESPKEFEGDPLEQHFRNAFEGKEKMPPTEAWEGIVWKKAFESRSVSPPPAVWHSIKTALHPPVPLYLNPWFRLAAVASLFLMISLPYYFGGYKVEEMTVSESFQSEEGTVWVEIDEIETANSVSTNTSEAPITSARNETAGGSQIVIAQANNSTIEKLGSVEAASEAKPQLFDAYSSDLFQSISSQLASLEIENPSHILDPIQSDLRLMSNAPSMPALQLSELSPYENKRVFGDAKPVKIPKPNTGIYTQFGFSSGGFNPNFSMQEADILNAYAITRTGSSERAIAVQPQIGDRQSPERTMVVNLGFGYQINRHFVLETGVMYGHHTTMSVSNVVASPMRFSWEKPVTIAVTNEDRLRPQMEFEITDPYDIRNSFDIVSIPIIGGIQVPINNMHIMLRSGLSSNFMINNRISDPSGRLIREIIRPGQNSPYQNMFLQGMVGSEIGFKVSNVYTLGFQGSYQFGLTNMAREHALFTSNPSQFSFGLMLRYQLPRF
jgi:hypothetical protein